MYFCHFLKNGENSDYVNYLKNNILHESLNVTCIHKNMYKPHLQSILTSKSISTNMIFYVEATAGKINK